MLSNERASKRLFRTCMRAALAIVLSAALACGLCPASALALDAGVRASSSDELLTDQGFAYVVEDGAAYLRSVLSHEGTIVVPAQLGGYPVKGVQYSPQPDFAWSDDPIAVVLPEGLETLGDNAITQENVVAVELPSTLRSVGDFALAWCGFSSMSFPEGIESWGEFALSGNANLVQVSLPADMKAIPKGTFVGCESLASVVVPAGVATIGERAFDGCAALTEVYIPESVSYVDADAFDECGDLTVRYGGSRAQWEELMAASAARTGLSDESVTVVYDVPTPSSGGEEQKPVPETALDCAVYEDGAVVVSWYGHLNVETMAEVTGYEILRRQGALGVYEVVGRVDAGVIWFTDRTVEPYQSYVYTVRALSGSRVGPYDEKGVEVSTTEIVDTIMLCGSYRADGEYPVTFRTDAQDHDITHEFRYTEDYFRNSGLNYSHDLAKMSLGLVASGFSTRESDGHWYSGVDVDREANVRAAYETLGFGNAKFCAYDASLNSTEDKVACSFARKTYSRSGAVSTVVPVVLRGGGYGSEWASNFTVSDGSTHYGFRRAAEKVYDQLKTYLAEEAEKGELGTVKLWIVGYSRAAAVANLLAAKVCNELSGEMSAVGYESNVFAYTFATPAALTGDEEGAWAWDYDLNFHDSLLPSIRDDRTCIHNIIYSGDIVPRIPLDDWGYHRNGTDQFLPIARQGEDVAALNAVYRDITGASFDFAELASLSDVQSDENAFAEVCGSIGWYVFQYQDGLCDILQYANTKLPTDDGTKETALLKIAQLDNIAADGLSDLVVLRSTWAVAELAVPAVIGALGVDADPDAVVPYVTIGIMHGMTPDVVGVLLQFLAGSLDGVTVDGLAAGHHPEVYLALMEHFGEDGYEARPTEVEEPSRFADVEADAWYAGVADYVSARGIMDGYSGTEDFGPDDPMLRQDVACLLFKWLAPERAATAGLEANESGLSDVEDGAYYTAAVNWCVDAGVLSGYSGSNMLGVGDPITREQMATILYRASGASGAGEIAGTFSDKADVSAWAVPAMAWAVDDGVVSGSDGRLLPLRNATRAEVAAMIMRLG